MPVRFTPQSSVFKGSECRGINIIVTDRARFRPVLAGIEIAVALHRLSAGLEGGRLFATAGQLGHACIESTRRDSGRDRWFLSAALQTFGRHVRAFCSTRVQAFSEPTTGSDENHLIQKMESIQFLEAKQSAGLFQHCSEARKQLDGRTYLAFAQ